MRAIPHESADAHVTGAALYTDDLCGRFPDLLHAWPVTSPHAHARVLRISTNGVPNAQYTMATTTGSLSGSYSKSDTTAFAFKINPLGASYLNGGNLGIATTSPVTAHDVASGTIRAYSISTSTCAAANDGAVFYNAKDKHLYVCEATVWQLIK